MKRLMLLFFLFPQQSFSKDWQQQILEDAAAVYSPHALESFGVPLEIIISPDSGIAASPYHLSSQLKVVVNRGLLESPRLTPDSLRIVLCHELGHLFGGAPRSNLPVEWDGPRAPDGRSYFSSEGQADYYATAVCFRKLVEQAEGGQLEPADMDRVGPELRRKCSEIASLRGGELKLCYRASLGGYDFLTMNFDFQISCEHEDPNIVRKLARDHYPRRQCRLDTMIRGAYCRNNLPTTLDFNDMSKNECKTPEAFRPACWFSAN